MAGATHFIEIYKSHSGTIKESPLFKINALKVELRHSKATGFKTLFVWKIKSKAHV